MSVQALPQRPSWAALKKHHQKIKRTHLRQLFAKDPARGEKLTVEAAGTLSRLFQEPDHRRNPGIAASTGPGVGAAGAHRRHVSRRQDQHLGEARRAARRPARAARRFHPARRPECGARGPRRAGQDGGFRRSRTQRRLEGPYRQAHPQCDQCRHRRLRSRPRDGLRSAQALQRARHDLPLRLQCRWHGLRRGGAGSRSRRDAVHHFLQDLHHARDHDQRAYRA